MADPVWVPRLRDYQEESKWQPSPVLTRTVLRPSDVHPLQMDRSDSKPADTDKVSKSTSISIIDPLSLAAAEAESHPLDGHPLSEVTDVNYVPSGSPKPSILKPTEEEVPQWDSKKAGILMKFTTDEAIPVPSFVSGVTTAKVPQQGDKIQKRLEQLDQGEDDGEILQLTQKDYQKHIEKKRDELIKAWDKEKRVKALKTAIKCAKLLGETEKVVQFYPSKFVLITEILDTFGNLVFDRIKRRSTIYDDDLPIPLKDNFRCEDVVDHAKETCKNWFFKIASIRELLPRIYVEMAIVQSYRFIENDTFPTIFTRLAKMIRGIADPMVAQYARCYLARKGREVLRDQKDYLLSGFKDFMFHEKLFKTEKMSSNIENRGITNREYLELFSPSLDWTLECLGHKAWHTILESVLVSYGECQNGFVLNSILSSFHPSLICKHAIDFVNLIKKVSDDTLDKLSLYRVLGLSLVASKPPEQHKLKILNEVWKDVTKETNIKKYTEVAEVYIGYPIAHLSFKEVDTLLKDILDHVKSEQNKQNLEQQQLQLKSIIQKILSSNADFHQIFSMKNFLSFLDLFKGETQTEVNKALLNNFNKTPGTVSDTIVINTMFSVAKTVHDSINALSFDDEKREISVLICNFIQKLDFGRDLEKQLNFFVEARRAFVNLDTVKVELVKGACLLTVRTQIFVEGKLNKQTSAFVRACIAYCYITIPSIELYFERLYLFTLAGQVAIINQSLSQADSLFKSAIELARDIPHHIEERDGKQVVTSNELISYLKYFLSILVAVPGHPDRGTFYLLQGFKTVVKEYDWDPKGTSRITIYIAMIQCLCAIYQKKQPYEWDKVESNFILYGWTEAHLKSMVAFINTIVADINDEFQRLQSENLPILTAQGASALELVNVAIATGNVTTPGFVNFIGDHFRHAKKCGMGPDRLQSIIHYAYCMANKEQDSNTKAGYTKLVKTLEDIKNQKGT